MQRATVVLFGVGAVLAALGTAQAGAQEMQSDTDATPSMQQQIVFHSQGWGVLGEGVAAHAPGREPMVMQIADRKYTSGLGTHAPSETVLMLDGRFKTFTAEVGVQWQNGQPGSVVFKVLVDGEEVFDSGVMKGADAAKHVEVSLAGASELRLVTEDAGDGIENDLGNWANARLEPDPQAKPVPPAQSVDMAPFAKIMSWDPARMEGTQATRLETMPEEDLFPGQQVLPGNDGTYQVPTYGDGRGCIGLEWLERRRLARIEVELAGGLEHPEGAEFQIWRMAKRGGSPGGSRWQGTWIPTDADVRQEGQVWIIEPKWENQELQSGVLKVRGIFAPSAQPIRIRAIRAYTRTYWKTADLLIQAANGAGGTATCSMYNGQILDPADSPLQCQWNLAEPLRLTVRYCPARQWEITDRTVLRFALPSDSFGVAVDDVVEQGVVYVEHAGLLVTKADNAITPQQYQQSVAEQKTVLDRVRSMPDQTVAQAMRHVYRPDADLGPTLLSLACDNRKFLVEREGTMSWDNDPKVFNHFATQYPGVYSCRMIPAFGQGDHDYVTRQNQRDWLPVQVLTVANGRLQYRQRTFVAPFGKDTPRGSLEWVQYRPLGVAEFTIFNRHNEAADANLALKFIRDVTAEGFTVKEEVPAEVRQDGNRFSVLKGGELIALVDVNDPQQLQVAVDQGTVRISGSLAGKGQAGCVVYFPRWQGATASDLEGAPAADVLAGETESYWMRVMEPAMQVEVPDDLINKLIPASQLHCMLAARNEDGERIAPWIGSIHYGPLESEAHSILRGMGAVGQEDFTRRGLEYYATRINDEGFLTTGYTVMGTGWHLWTLGEFYRLTRDQDWLRSVAPQIAKACRWVMTERAKTMKTDDAGNKVPEYGLMPPGVGADWEVYAYYFYLNGYYCAGLGAAADALADVGWEGAQEMQADAANYRECILRAFEYVQDLAPVFALKDGTWVPEYPTHVYAPSPIENFYPGEDAGRSWCYDVELGSHHLIPMGIIAPDGPTADWTINHMEDVQFLRKGWFYYEDPKENEADWFNLGGFAKVQPYYARTGEVHALRDDVKPFIRTYFNSVMSLLNREDLSLWEHFVNGAFNKTHETGYYIHQSRLMLVQERGDELWLAPFVTSNWLRDGMRVAVRQAPTFFGTVGYSITSHVADGYMDAEITPPQRQAPKAVVIRLRHPDGKALQDAEVSGAAGHTVNAEDSTIHVTPGSGPIAIRARYAQ